MSPPAGHEAAEAQPRTSPTVASRSEDVAYGMFVGLSGVTAALAGEFCLGDPILRCFVATRFAGGGQGTQLVTPLRCTLGHEHGEI